MEEIKTLQRKDRMPGILLLLISIFLPLQLLSQKSTVVTDAGEVKVEIVADSLAHPWGMAFLPDGRLLVTERAGSLRILDSGKISEPLSGTPEVFSQGQGGMLDVALHPDFEENNWVYLTFSEPTQDAKATTALGRGKLVDRELQDFEVIYRMHPAVEGPNHFGGRIVFTDNGYLFLTLAERFKFDPAQNLSNTLGTIVRLNQDGTVPDDNPFVGNPNAEDEIWSYGHRNIESAAIEPQSGILWVAEMGPMGGDELNRPEPGKNYGWPIVSWGDHYDGSEIPDPPTKPEFADAVITWTPTISPSGMSFYTGDMFPEWQNSMLIGGLTAAGLVRVETENEAASEVERIPLVKRIRDVEQAPDGSVYVLTDEPNGNIMRLHRLN